MKKRIRILVFILVVAVMTSVNGLNGSSGREIVIALDATWPPMEYTDENNSVVGFDVDLMNASAEAGGYTVRFVNVAWDGIFSGLEVGKYDAICSSVSVTDERKEKMDISIPYINAGQVIVSRVQGKRAQSLDDLAKMKCGVQIGTTGDVMLSDKNLDHKVYDEVDLMFLDLAAGRIDALIVDMPIAAFYSKHNDKYSGKFFISSRVLVNDFYGVCVEKGNSKVLGMINSGLTKIIGNGKYKELCIKWFGIYEPLTVAK